MDKPLNKITNAFKLSSNKTVLVELFLNLVDHVPNNTTPLQMAEELMKLYLQKYIPNPGDPEMESASTRSTETGTENSVNSMDTTSMESTDTNNSLKLSESSPTNHKDSLYVRYT